MLITIAIPTYNNEKTIGGAIQSALNQLTSDEYEVLIVNNASTDNTSKVIETFSDEKIRVVVNPQTVDMYANHNVCLREAKGDYILFCHADDELLPTALSILSDKIKERNYPPKYIVWGHSIYRDFYPRIEIAKQSVNVMFSGEFALKCFLSGGLTPSGTCYSRKPLIEMGGFPSSNSKSPEMDWVILVLATYNFFEFEMMDRIIYKRVYATTALDSFTTKDWMEIHHDTFDIMFGKLSKKQKDTFLNMMLNFGPTDMLPSVKTYVSYTRYIKEMFKRKIRKITRL